MWTRIPNLAIMREHTKCSHLSPFSLTHHMFSIETMSIFESLSLSLFLSLSQKQKNKNSNENDQSDRLFLWTLKESCAKKLRYTYRTKANSTSIICETCYRNVSSKHTMCSQIWFIFHWIYASQNFISVYHSVIGFLLPSSANILRSLSLGQHKVTSLIQFNRQRQ